ncbi:hypothetical protein SM0020_28325 [Sinorhizobium meliloti CCNWSX0020]|uniref:Uncharacterized protein n=1 Tax=Sinorhizobium meliloti CCNWSX0020 TaxID=1107881 RepID=H0G830_RHIML|nr:hypothetical protein SM0020_28325 [Sinorhizobium meliloti CCNWSX0020]PII37616.1 hypothetical protein T190_30970 [Sinorhizobium meliloti CCBAU 01290]
MERQAQCVVRARPTAKKRIGRLDVAQTRVKSDGKSKTIAFSLSVPGSATASPTRRIVARLERADGWLVARGSIQLKAGAPVHLTLNPVIY